jgi:membrane protein DedA with SNARE-associated domain
MAKPNAPQKTRVENALAFMMAGVIGISILAILVVLLAYLLNFHQLPPLLALMPMIGLPFGALLMIALVIVQARNRAKDKR